jgi:hypothetical protein
VLKSSGGNCCDSVVVVPLMRTCAVLGVSCSVLLFVACLVLECLLGWTDSSFYNVIVSLSVVCYMYYLEFRVVGVDACVVHMQSVFTHLIYIISLQCVQVLSFSLCF